MGSDFAYVFRGHFNEWEIFNFAQAGLRLDQGEWDSLVD
jgi:hypothetical protein